MDLQVYLILCTFILVSNVDAIEELYDVVKDQNMSSSFVQSFYIKSLHCVSKFVCVGECSKDSSCKGLTYSSQTIDTNCFLYSSTPNTSDTIYEKNANIHLKKIVIRVLETTNLVKNSYALEGFKYWCFSSDVGSPDFSDLSTVDIGLLWQSFLTYQITSTDAAIGDPYLWAVEFGQYNTTTNGFVTSYALGEKFQIIDLYVTYGDAILTTLPTIFVSELYESPSGCHYSIAVYLLDVSFQIVDSFKFSVTLPGSNHGWYSVNHTFQNYPTYVRYVVYYHAGSDTLYWSGYYGAKITGSTILVTFP